MAKQSQVATVNIFDVGTKPTAPSPKKAKKERAEIQLGPVLDTIASFKVMEKICENEVALHMSEAKDTSLDAMVDFCYKTKLPPESLLGTGERATASVEIRRKGSNQALTADAILALTANNIEIGKEVVVPERFVFNPNLDQATLLRISNAIMKDPTLRAMHEEAPIIQKQPEEAINVATDETIRGIAKLNDKEVVKDLLKATTTMAIGKFGFDGERIEQDKQVTEDAKAVSILHLQAIGVLPKPEAIERKRNRKKAPTA